MLILLNIAHFSFSNFKRFFLWIIIRISVYILLCISVCVYDVSIH